MTTFFSGLRRAGLVLAALFYLGAFVGFLLNLKNGAIYTSFILGVQLCVCVCLLSIGLLGLCSRNRLSLSQVLLPLVLFIVFAFPFHPAAWYSAFVGIPSVIAFGWLTIKSWDAPKRQKKSKKEPAEPAAAE